MTEMTEKMRTTATNVARTATERAVPEIGPSIETFKEQVYARSGTEDLPAHLEDRYGIRVAELTELDLGVFRVDRHDGPPWVARVFSALRPLAQVQGDAEALRFLEEHGFPAERCARADAVSTLEGQGVLVTEHVPGTPARRGPRTLHILGDLLGRLHTLPAGSGASARDSGSWHHLSLRGGGRREDIDALTALLADVERVAPSDQRALCASLCEDVARTDDGRDLPSAFIHPDFTPPNVIVAPEVGPVLIDWTGAGRGPRVSSLGFLLWAAGGRDLGLVDAVIAGYRAHVRLDVDERARLADAVRAPSLILECWSVVCGRARLPEIVGRLSTNRDLAEAIAARARAGFDR